MVMARIISPCFASCYTWESHCLASLYLTFLLAARDRAFLLQPGSSVRASQIIAAGLKLFLANPHPVDASLPGVVHSHQLMLVAGTVLRLGTACKVQTGRVSGEGIGELYWLSLLGLPTSS